MSQSFNPIYNSENTAVAAGTTQMPLVTVVILNWNGEKYLEQFLPALLASGYSNKKIIVADNASTDDSINFFTATFSFC